MNWQTCYTLNSTLEQFQRWDQTASEYASDIFSTLKLKAAAERDASPPLNSITWLVLLT